MGLFNKKKKIAAYALKSKDVADKFLTITETAAEAVEYAMIILMLRHKGHYEAWCENIKLDKCQPKSVVEYYQKCIPDSEKLEFTVIKVYYSLNSIMAALRMLGNCYPIGCSFDLPIEHTYFQEILAETLVQQAAQKLQKAKAKEENVSDGNK